MIVVVTIIIFLIIGGIYTYIDKRNKIYCPKCGKKLIFYHNNLYLIKQCPKCKYKIIYKFFY